MEVSLYKVVTLWDMGAVSRNNIDQEHLRSAKPYIRNNINQEEQEICKIRRRGRSKMVVWLRQCLLVLLPVLSVSDHQSSPMNDPGELVDLIMDKTDNVEVVVALDGSTMAGQDIGNR